MADSPDADTGNGAWIDLCSLSNLPETGGHFVNCDNRQLAVFRTGDEVRVTDDTCPHAGGSLSAGYVSDGCVVCPRHGWTFEIDTGKCPDSLTLRIATYPARVVDGQIQSRIE